MKYGCENKTEILLRLNYMVIHAPDSFPPEGGMTLELAFATVEYGLRRIEEIDGRPQVVEAVNQIRPELLTARKLFDEGEVVPACHKLQDVEDILRSVHVKTEVWPNSEAAPPI